MEATVSSELKAVQNTSSVFMHSDTVAVILFAYIICFELSDLRSLDRWTD